MNTRSVENSISQHRLKKATEMLLGLVTGMVLDDHLHDREVQFLHHWLLQNEEVASTWPGSAIAHKVRDVLQDGVITEAERAHLLDALKDMATTDFSETGQVSPSVIGLPVQDDVSVVIRDADVCHTGVFLYGTRAACERLTERGGGFPVSNVTKKTDVLVIGSNVSPDWAHTSYGRKIEAAVGLRESGHPIVLITEHRWLQVLDGAGA